MKKSFSALFIIISLVLTFGCKGGETPSKPEEITTGTITGKAVYQNAAESSGITVTLEKTDGLRSLSVVRSIELGFDDFSARSIAGNSTTDKEGNYTFTDVEEGVYTIYASSKDSTEKAVTTNVVVERNTSVTAEDLKLTATGNISGKITLDNSETESYGFLVYVAGTSYSAMTAEDGTFLITGVPAESNYKLIITKQQLTYMFEEPVTVTAKETVSIPAKNFTASEITTGNTNGKDGTSINWRGSFALEEEIENPKYLDAYFNTADGCSYIYDGEKWTLLVQSGSKIKDAKIVYIGAFDSEDEIKNPENGWTYCNKTDKKVYVCLLGIWIYLRDATNNDFITITFNPNLDDSDGSMETLYIYADEKIVLPEVKYNSQHYDFIGWNTEADGSGVTYSNKAEFNVTLGKNIQLYAQWKLSEFTIEYNPNFDSWSLDDYEIEYYWRISRNDEGEFSSVQYPANAEVFVSSCIFRTGIKSGPHEDYDSVPGCYRLSGPIRNILNPGYLYQNKKFLYWNTKSDGTGKCYKEGEKISVNKNEKIILYAIWGDFEYPFPLGHKIYIDRDLQGRLVGVFLYDQAAYVGNNLTVASCVVGNNDSFSLYVIPKAEWKDPDKSIYTTGSIIKSDILDLYKKYEYYVFYYNAFVGSYYLSWQKDSENQRYYAKDPQGNTIYWYDEHWPKFYECADISFFNNSLDGFGLAINNQTNDKTNNLNQRYSELIEDYVINRPRSFEGDNYIEAGDYIVIVCDTDRLGNTYILDYDEFTLR